MKKYLVKVPICLEIVVPEGDTEKAGNANVVYKKFFKALEEDSYGIFLETEGFDCIGSEIAKRMFDNGKVLLDRSIEFTRYGWYPEGEVEVYSIDAIFSFCVEGELKDEDFDSILFEVNDVLKSPEELRRISEVDPFQFITEHGGRFSLFEVICGRPHSIEESE